MTMLEALSCAVFQSHKYSDDARGVELCCVSESQVQDDARGVELCCVSESQVGPTGRCSRRGVVLRFIVTSTGR